MSRFIAYRILTYLLLPVAFLLGTTLLMAIPMALAYPNMLLMVFMMVAVVIYTFTSFRFLHAGLLKRHPLSASLKDWIKVNGYVAIAFGIMMAINSYVLLTRPADMKDLAVQQAEIFKTNPRLLEQMMQKILYLMLAYGFCLLVHIGVTLVLLQRFPYLFSSRNNDE